jgi:hypothetical protein
MPLSSSNLPSPISHLRRASALLLPIFGALAPLLAADFPEPTPHTHGNRKLQG